MISNPSKKCHKSINSLSVIQLSTVAGSDRLGPRVEEVWVWKLKMARFDLDLLFRPIDSN